MSRSTAQFSVGAGLLLVCSVGWVLHGGRVATPPEATRQPVERSHGPLAETCADCLRSPVPQPAAAASGAYAAPAGSELDFAVAGRSTTALRRGANGAPSEVALSFHASLCLAVLARREHEILAKMTLLDVVLQPSASGATPDSAAGAGLARELASAFLMHMRDDGQTLGYRFEPQAGPEARNFCRALISGLRFVVPVGHGDAWQAEETDACGRFVASYARGAAGSEVEKRKLRYCAERAVPTVAGAGAARVGAACGWLEAGHFTEHLELAIAELGLDVRQESRLEFALREHRWKAPSGEVAWDAEWDALDGQADAVELGQQREREQFAAQLEGVTAATIVARIAALAQSARLDTEDASVLLEQLRWLVRLRPESLQALSTLVLDAALPRGALQAIVMTVAEAQTLPGQELLARWLRDDSMRDEVRWSAALASGSLQAPQPFLVAALDRAFAEEGTPVSLRSTALLSLGALAAGHSANGASEDSPVDRLLAHESKARAAGVVATWLEALGNAGDPRCLPVAQHYLRDGDEQVRASAVSALRRLAVPEATRAVIAAMESDAAPAVRAQAAAQLVARSVPAAMESIERMLTREKEPEVRQAAVVGLARSGVRDAAVLRMLRLVAGGDSSEDLRALAARVLATAARPGQ